MSLETSCDFRHFSKRLPLLVNIHSKKVKARGLEATRDWESVADWQPRVAAAPFLEESAIKVSLLSISLFFKSGREVVYWQQEMIRSLPSVPSSASLDHSSDGPAFPGSISPEDKSEPRGYPEDM